MDPSIDLEQTITDAVNDSQLPDEPEVDTQSYDATPETPDASISTDTPDASQTSQDAPQDAQTSIQVSSPGSQQPAAPKDDFERLAGMPAIGISGKENRIPYHRVKAITSRAVGQAVETAIGRKLGQNENPLDAVKTFTAEVGTLRNEHKDYATRLEAVGQFENLMVNTPDAFLKKLASLPQYQPFFDFMEQAYQAFEANGNTWTANSNQQMGAATPEKPISDPAGDMPEPDETLPDGSKQYSMNGIRQLLDWQERRTTSKVTSDVTKQFESRYGPIEKDWQTKQREAAMLPIVQMQIAEAKTWPMFNELQPEIETLLEKDPNISLEAAYRKIAFPRILAERSKIKQDVLREMQQAPTGNSSVGQRVVSRPNPPNMIPEGAGRLEAIIASEVEKLKR